MKENVEMKSSLEAKEVVITIKWRDVIIMKTTKENFY